jgi:CMP-N,N'-diacetyllegionaminic acid synthase
MGSKITCVIPARYGSLRVPNKNIRNLNGHPIIAYSIQTALDSKIFESITVASNSEYICQIAEYYGASNVVKRPEEDSTSTSLDIEWLTNLYIGGHLNTDYFSIFRPTSPLRTLKFVNSCVDLFLKSNSDSLRTISKVKEHPGKMWEIHDGGTITPYLNQTNKVPATHAMQYQSLPELYVQTSVFEIAKTSVINETNSREGKSIIGVVTEGIDSHSIDSEADFEYLKYLVEVNPNLLPIISKKPFSDNK